MVKIPTQKDPTLVSIRHYLEKSQDGNRGYLGASTIGDECARKVWYQYNREPSFDSDAILRFNDGHRTEDAMAWLLRGVDGVELWTHDENGEQFGFEDGNFKGHVDGVIRGLLHAPKTTAVWECKCTEKLKDFQKAKESYGSKGALQGWNETYYIQAQIYMHYLKLERHYTTVCSAGLRDFDSCWTEYKQDVALKNIDRAKKILEQNEPPPQAYNSSTFYKCRWCQFNKECWGENS